MTDKSKLIFVLLLSANLNILSAHYIQVYKSKSIAADSSKKENMIGSKQVKTFKAKDIEVYKSKALQPAGSKPFVAPESKAGVSIKINLNKDANKINEETELKQENKGGIKDNNPPAIESFIGVWRTRIPGGVWQTPSGIAGYDNLHVSAGAKSGDLIIRKDGTYKWNSYGGKEGKWEKGNSDYPVLLIDNVEHKKWKVGIDPKHTGGRDIVIWDGNYWYNGKK